MKIPKALLLLSAFLGSAAAVPADTVRSFKDIPGFSSKVLERTISAKIYKHLLVSPVEAWISVRGRLSNGHISGARVIHSEANGAYDQYALQVAREIRIAGYGSLGHVDPTASVLVNVLIYEIADGTMALSFPSIDQAGGEQLEYYGGAKLAVQQMNGQWKPLALPDRPLARGAHATVSGNGWAVRDGIANNYELQMKLNQVN